MSDCRIKSLISVAAMLAALAPAISFASGHGAAKCAIKPLQLKFGGNISNIKDRSELSGAVLSGKRLFVVSNEGVSRKRRKHALQIFKQAQNNAGVFELSDARTGDFELLTSPTKQCREADFEALALHGQHIFAITSHSRNRKKVKYRPAKLKDLKSPRPGQIEKNLDNCEERATIMRIRLDGDKLVLDKRLGGKSSPIRALIEKDPILAPFAKIPSKENGIDIEGLAANRNGVFVGFRGPVLRQNLAPILRLDHELRSVTDTASRLWANLSGRGIRGMSSKDDEIYFLAGPNGDERQSFAIYIWDGSSLLENNADWPIIDARQICELGAYEGSRPEPGKPEALFLVEKTENTAGAPISARFILVYDGERPHASELTIRWQVARPNR